jgi:dihydroorotate dehydrogenase
MPDWSYRTVLRPLLFTLPPRAARGLALGVMGPLGRARTGRLAIDFLGHMRPPAILRTSLLGLEFPTRIGIGCGLDPDLEATAAFARFGVGFVEVGPFTAERREAGRLGIDAASETLLLPGPAAYAGDGGRLVAARLATTGGVPVLARLDLRDLPPDRRAVQVCLDLMAALAPHVSAFTLALPSGAPVDAPWPTSDVEWSPIVEAGHRDGTTARPVLLVVPADLDGGARAITCARATLFDGVVVEGAHWRDGGDCLGAGTRRDALDTVRALRNGLPPGTPIVAGGGVHEPQHALDLLAAGADLVSVDSGLLFGGPGLPKRINDAILATLPGLSPGLGPGLGAGLSPGPGADTEPAARMSWLWTMLMGVGMLLGGGMALAIATTRVVLPYDEHFVGLTRYELGAVNARLLPFLTHDRVTLAGAMASIGVLYVGLSWFGSRRGRHWAQVAIVASGAAGFVSFFLFLGFGYFDPFHAFVTAILFQLLVMGFHGRVGPPRDLPAPMLVEDRAWQCGLWGQLLLVVQGTGFIGAGLVISAIGATRVFVHEDLEFLGTTAPALAAAAANLVPLVAHDRATLGGMLLANGLVILLTALWGFRPGERWLWWTLLLTGLPGYATAIGVHYAVGYESAFHLAPAFVGLALFAAALAAAYPSLARRS